MANPAEKPVGHCKMIDCNFAGNKMAACPRTGVSPAFKDIDAAVLDLVDNKVMEELVAVEMDESRLKHLQPVAGSEAAMIGAGAVQSKRPNDRGDGVCHRTLHLPCDPCGIHATSPRLSNAALDSAIIRVVAESSASAAITTRTRTYFFCLAACLVTIGT